MKQTERLFHYEDRETESACLTAAKWGLQKYMLSVSTSMCDHWGGNADRIKCEYIAHKYFRMITRKVIAC